MDNNLNKYIESYYASLILSTLHTLNHYMPLLFDTMSCIGNMEVNILFSLINKPRFTHLKSINPSSHPNHLFEDFPLSIFVLILFPIFNISLFFIIFNYSPDWHFLVSLLSSFFFSLIFIGIWSLHFFFNVCHFFFVFYLLLCCIYSTHFLHVFICASSLYDGTKDDSPHLANIYITSINYSIYTT